MCMLYWVTVANKPCVCIESIADCIETGARMLGHCTQTCSAAAVFTSHCALHVDTWAGALALSQHACAARRRRRALVVYRKWKINTLDSSRRQTHAEVLTFHAFAQLFAWHLAGTVLMLYITLRSRRACDNYSHTDAAVLNTNFRATGAVA